MEGIFRFSDATESVCVVCVQVNKATGFFRGLYSGPELDGKSIQVDTWSHVTTTV